MEVVGDVSTIPACGLEQWTRSMHDTPGEEDWIVFQAVIDSGAGASVGPRALIAQGRLKESFGSRTGQTFTSASGKVMKNEGEVVLEC